MHNLKYYRNIFRFCGQLFLGHTASTAIASSSCDVPKPDRQSAPTSILQASGEDEDVKVSLDLSDTAIVAQAVRTCGAWIRQTIYLIGF